MLALFLSLASAHGFDEPSRWLVTSEVELPAVIWMAADLNTEARMVAWRLEVVLDCPAAEPLRRGSEVVCAIEDIAVSGAAHPSDAGLLEKILLESDEKLTGAELTLRLGDDGALKAVALDGLPMLRRRQTAMKENLRLMLSRAVAGFDLPIPARDVEAGWDQRGSWVAQLPASAGTLAGGKVIHERTAANDHTWTIATRGRVTLEPHSQQEWPPNHPSNRFAQIEGPLHPLAWDNWAGSIGMVAWLDTDLRATGTVDAATGALIERSWSALSEPTPSSRVANGAKGYPYVQNGRIERLEPEAEVTLGASEEFEPRGDTPSAIQTWESLGAQW